MPSSRIMFCSTARPLKVNVVERACARVRCARRQQIELRNLPAIDRQLLHFARTHIAADARAGGIEYRRFIGR